jgi:hypothetical protein
VAADLEALIRPATKQQVEVDRAGWIVEQARGPFLRDQTITSGGEADTLQDININSGQVSNIILDVTIGRERSILQGDVVFDGRVVCEPKNGKIKKKRYAKRGGGYRRHGRHPDLIPRRPFGQLEDQEAAQPAPPCCGGAEGRLDNGRHRHPPERSSLGPLGRPCAPPCGALSAGR